jgi:hypothetical protein
VTESLGTFVVVEIYQDHPRVVRAGGVVVAPDLLFQLLLSLLAINRAEIGSRLPDQTAEDGFIQIPFYGGLNDDQRPIRRAS